MIAFAIAGLALGVATLAQPVLAQEWATPEVCAVTMPEIEAKLADPVFVKNTNLQSARIPNSVGRLWGITAANGAVSHLWGTIHSSAQPILDLPPEMRDRLDQSRVLAVEADHRYTDRASYQAATTDPHWWQDVSLPPQPVPFVDNADPRLSDWVRERAMTTGTDVGWVEYLSPAAILSLLLNDPCENLNAGVIPIQDSLIQTIAHIENILIIGLEESGEFIWPLNQTENRALAAALISTYASYLMPTDDNDPRVTYMALYRSGHLGAMMMADQAFVSETVGPSGAAAHAMTDQYLLETRNLAFLDNAGKDLKKGGVFMAVGAFHLPGDTGLVALLRDQGFTVRRVPVEGKDGL